MESSEFAQAMMAFEEAITRYINARRDKINDFTDRHFSLAETLQLQKKSLLADFILIPINSLWALPYLALKKIFETLDTMGISHFTPAFERIPSGIKTQYQKDIERLIKAELLDWPCTENSSHALWEEFKKDPQLAKILATEKLNSSALLNIDLETQLNKFSASRALVADLAATVGAIALGWLLFRDRGLSISGLGDRIARKIAHDNASSHFFLGKRAGSVFYNIFPAEPTKGQVFIATLAVGVILTLFSVLTGILSDPARKALGLQKRKIHELIDELEKNLLLNLRKRFKDELQQAVNSKVA